MRMFRTITVNWGWRHGAGKALCWLAFFGLMVAQGQAQSAGKFQFALSSFTASESETAVDNPTTDRHIPGALITVVRVDGTVGKMLVDFATTTNGTAAAGTNYVSTNGTLVFNNFQMSASFIVPIKDNSVSNANTTVKIELSNPRPADDEDQSLVPELGSVTNTTLTILDNDTGYNIARSVYRVTEKAGSVTIKVVLPEGGGDGFSVDYRVVRGSTQPGSDFATAGDVANAGTDVEAASGTLNFGQGVKEQTFTLQIVDDDLVEFNEDFIIELFNSKATIPVTTTNYELVTNIVDDVEVVETNVVEETEDVDLPMGQVISATVTILFDDQPAGSVDREYNPEMHSKTTPAYNPRPGANNAVYGIALQPDGKAVIGGDFTAVNAVPRNRVARLNTDGSLDQTFRIGTGADGFVEAVGVRDDGKVFIGGGFTSFNGLQRNFMARLNPDGSLDPAFNPGTSINGPVRAIGFTAMSQRIDRNAAGDDQEDRFVLNTGATSGRITIDYDFLYVPDFLRVYYQGVKLYDSGVTNGAATVQIPFGPGTSTDVTIVVNEGGGEWGTAWFYSVSFSATGGNKIIIGGDFTSIDGESRNFIAQLNDNGTLDRTFNPGTGANGPVYAVARQAGKILVGGDFTRFNGVPRNSIARLNADGSLDTTFDPGSGADGPVYALAVKELQTIYISGQSREGGEPETNVVQLPANYGLLDLNYIFQSNTNNVTTNTFRVYYGTNLIVNRTVTVPTTNGVSDSVSISFGPGAATSLSVIVNEGQTNSNVWSYNGSITTGQAEAGKVLIAGAFSTVDLQSRGGITQLNASGSLDASFNPGTGADNDVYAMALDPGGKIYIGGVFTKYNGTWRHGMARLFPTGKLDTSFMDTACNQYAGLVSTSTLEPGQFISAMAIESSGNLLIGGSFTRLGGDYSINVTTNNVILGMAPYLFVHRRDRTITRYNFARMLAGSTPGPGNVGFESDTYHVDENAITARIVLQRINGSLGPAAISFTTLDGTAIAGEDYEAGDFSFEWQSGDTNSWSIPIGIIDDNQIEGDETFRLKASFASGVLLLNGEPIPLGAGLDRDSAIVAIADNDFTPGKFSFNQPNYSIDENAGTATITVIRTDGHTGSVTVDYATRTPASGSRAMPGIDYVAKSGTLFFASGQTNKTFTVTIIDDILVEPDETLELVLSNPKGGAKLGSLTNATLTIIDNDFAPGRISFTTTNFTALENSTNAVVSVKRTGGSVGTASVQYFTSDGTAWAGVHYAATSGMLSWSDGETANKTFAIPLGDDFLVEGNKTVNLTLTQFGGALPGSLTNSILTIIDDDSFGQLSFSATNYTVGENEGFVTVTIRRTGGTAGAVSVDYATSDGTAKKGTDYIAVTNTISLAPAQTSTNFVIQIVNDDLAELIEHLNVTLLNPVNAVVGGITNATITIVDDELYNVPAGQIDVSYNPQAGANNFIYALAMQGDGRLILGGDFTAVNGVSRNQIARLNDNGSLDSLFNLGTGVNGSVRSLIMQPDNRILIGGLFTTVHGTNRNYIARLNTDGSVDASFNPGAGADNPIYAVALQHDSRILVGGDFTTIMGISRNAIARLNTNGVLDANFNPGSGANGTVYAIATQTDGKIIIGGSFTAVNNVPQNGYARLNPNGTLDRSFNAGSGTDDSVRTIAIQSDGKIVLGGLFTSINGINYGRITRLNVDGSVDKTFNIGTGANNVVYAIAVQGDEKLLVSGDFTRFNGVTRNRITRLNRDGTVDPTINFGTGADGFVAALAIQPDRKIVLGGGFAKFNGVTHNRLVRIHGGSMSGRGSLEFVAPEFVVEEGVTNAVIRVRRTGGTTGTVTVDYSTTDGTAWAGADYLGAAGTLVFPEGETVQTISIRILNDTLVEPDETFNIILRNPTGGAALGGQPTAIVTIVSDDSVVGFSSSNFSVNENVATGNTTINVLRSGATNSTVTVYYGVTGGTATPGSDYLPASGQLIFAPGETNKSFSITIYDDQLVEGNETVMLALYNLSANAVFGQDTAVLTIIDNDFAPGAISFSSQTYEIEETGNYAVVTVTRRNGNTGVVTVQYKTSNGTATAGMDYISTNGILTFADGEISKSFLVQILDDAEDEGNETIILTLSNPTGGALIGSPSTASLSIIDNDFGPGSLDPTFNPGSGANGTVSSMVIQPDGKIVIGGAFTSVSGYTYSRVARLTTNGPPDSGFINNGADATVNSVRLTSGGQIIIGGNFRNVGSLSRSWVGRIMTNGVVDTTFNVSASENAQVFSAVPQSDGKIIIGGEFTRPIGRIARLTVNGSLDIGFNPDGGTDDIIYTVALQKDGKILIGGAFTKLGAINRNNIARLNSNGLLDTSFSVGAGPNGPVYVIVLQPDGKILIGGDFTTVGGVSRQRIARLNPEGSLDASFKPGNGLNGTVRAIALQPNGKVFVAGSFTQADTIARTRIARLNVDGTPDLTFSPGRGPDGTVNAVAVQSDGQILIGGSFTTVNGVSRNRIARLQGGDIREDSKFQSITRLLNGEYYLILSNQPGGNYLIQASTNLVNWMPLSTNKPAGSTWEFIDTNAPSFNQRFYRAVRIAP